MKEFLQKYWVAVVLGLIIGFGLHILFCQFLCENQAKAEIPPPPPCQQEFQAGWTLMSMPSRPFTDPDEMIGWKEIYTEGIVVYYFWKGGYVRVAEDQPLGFGLGYWIYHKKPVVYTVLGEEISYACVPLQCERLGHWYMIGATSGWSEIYSDEECSWVVYGYNQDAGYTRVEFENGELLEPGQGYWFKADGLPAGCENGIPYIGIREVVDGD